MPKQMTVRYTDKQEQEIQWLMRHLDESTMTKAFLKTPATIQMQVNEIARLRQELREKKDECWKLQQIVNSWSVFTGKLESYLAGEGFKKHRENEQSMWTDDIEEE